MKKYFILMFSISFLFFSCASTNIEEAKTEESTLENENIENNEQITEQNQENQNNSLTENDEIEKNENLISEQYPELEEIIEPEITELEWKNESEENQEILQENDEEKSEEFFEEIPEEEFLIPTDELDQIPEKSSEENQSNQQENEKIEENKNDESSLENNDENFSQEDEIIDIFEDDEVEDINEIDEIDDVEEIDENDNSENSILENKENIIPSRKISLKIGQTLEVVYPGSGWIFMGATDNSKDFTFLGKKLGTQNTKFSFKAKNSGNKILHFYKNDILSQNYIDDYLEVEILNEKDSSAKTITAPEYKQIITKKQQNDDEISVETKNEQINNSENNSVEETKSQEKQTQKEEIFNEEPFVEEDKFSLSEDKIKSLLIEAKNLFSEKKYKESLEKLSLFIEFSSENRDEALFLQGQIYESNSDYKNIKKALESYKNLTKNYPASSYWDSANKRIIYLTKFYLEGR